MLSFKECWNIADKYVLEIADAWENDEAYFLTIFVVSGAKTMV